MLNVKPLVNDIFYPNNGILTNLYVNGNSYNLSFCLIFHLFLIMKNINRQYNNVEVFYTKGFYSCFKDSLHLKFFLSISSDNIFLNLLFTFNNQFVMFYESTILFIKQNIFLCFLMHKKLIKFFKEFIMINRNKIVDAFWARNIKNIEDISIFEIHIQTVLNKLENNFDSNYFEELNSTEKEFLLMSLCLNYFD